MGRFADLLGTVLTSFGIGPKGARATLSAAGLSADRTLTLPDKTGTVATLDSPAFTGTPTAPTPATSDSSDRIATTALVDAKLTASGGGGTTYEFALAGLGGF